MGVPRVLSTETVVHIDRKVTSSITKIEAMDVLARLTINNGDFDATADQWTAFDVDILERALARVKKAVER